MIEESQVKEYDTTGMGCYDIREAARVFAVQLTENVPEMLRLTSVDEYEETSHKVIRPNGNKNNIRSWTEKRYHISNGSVAYVGDWLVYNGNYVQVMGDDSFRKKYAVND